MFTLGDKTLGHVQFNKEGNVFTWMLSSADLQLSLKHSIVASDIFNIHRNDKGLCNFRLKRNDCFYAGPTGDDIVLKRIWHFYLCFIEQDIEFTWKGHYEVSILENDTILEIRKKNDFVFNDNGIEESILRIPLTVIEKAIKSKHIIKIQCKLTTAEDEFDPKLTYERMFLNKQFSDIRLRTKCGNEVPAHRIVLATASPVFEAMFTHDMLENKRQLVDMVDISYYTVVEMLRYIYTGNVETQEFSMTAELMEAADKYQLQKLKNKCEHILGSNLSTENAMDALKFADKYNADHLKRKSVDFVKSALNGSLSLNEMSDVLLNKKSRLE